MGRDSPRLGISLTELECSLCGHGSKEEEFYATAAFFVKPLDLDFFSNLCLRHTQRSMPYSQRQRKGISCGDGCSRSTIYYLELHLERGGSPLVGEQRNSAVCMAVAWSWHFRTHTMEAKSPWALELPRQICLYN